MGRHDLKRAQNVIPAWRYLRIHAPYLASNTYNKERAFIANDGLHQEPRFSANDGRVRKCATSGNPLGQRHNNMHAC